LKKKEKGTWTGTLLFSLGRGEKKEKQKKNQARTLSFPKNMERKEGGEKRLIPLSEEEEEKGWLRL